MFKWFKILKRLSCEEQFLTAQEQRLQSLQETMDKINQQETACGDLLKKYVENIDKVQKESQDLIQKFEDFVQKATADITQIQELGDRCVKDGTTQFETLSKDIETKIASAQNIGSVLLHEVEGQVDKCSTSAATRMQTIKEEAEKYAAYLSDQIQNYENNFTVFNQKLEALKEAVTNFQR